MAFINDDAYYTTIHISLMTNKYNIKIQRHKLVLLKVRHISQLYISHLWTINTKLTWTGFTNCAAHITNIHISLMTNKYNIKI